MTLALIGFIAAVNPAAASLAIARNRRTNRPVLVAAGAFAALAALVALAASADPLLDGLGINLGTYRLGAGIVLAVAGLRWLAAGAVSSAEEPETDRSLAGFVAFPTLLTPGAVVLAVSIGAEEGTLTVAGSALVAVALGGIAVHHRRAVPAVVAAASVRLLGAIAAVVGVIVAVDGIRTL